MYTAQRMQLSHGCTWRTVKNLRNLLLATFLDRDAFNFLFPYLGRKTPVVLIGQPKNLSLVLNK